MRRKGSTLTLVLIAILAPASAQAAFAPENDEIATSAEFPEPSAISTDLAGTSTIAWGEPQPAGTMSEPRARRLSPGGDLGPVLELSPGSPSYEPQVAMGPGGRAFAAWRAPGPVSQEASALGRWIEPDGALGPLLTIGKGELGVQDVVELSVVVDPAGVATVAWRNQVNQNLALRRIGPDSSMGPLLPEVSSSVDNLKIAALPNGSTVAVFDTAFVESLVVTSDLEVSAQMNLSSTNEVSDPSIAVDSAGNGLVAWRDGLGESSGFGVAAARLSPTGAPAGGEIIIEPRQPDGVDFPIGVAADAADDFLVSWSHQDGTNSYVVKALGINSAGVFTGPAQPLSASGSVALSSKPTLFDSGGGAVAWRSFQGMATSGLGRAVNRAGAPTGDLTTIASGATLTTGDSSPLGVAAYLFRAGKSVVVRRFLEPPICGDSTFVLTSQGSVSIPLACDSLSIEGGQALTPPRRGVLEGFSGAGPSVTYKPRAGAGGNDVFTFAMSNDGGASKTATVSILDEVKPQFKRLKLVGRRGRYRFVGRLSEPAKVLIKISGKNKKGKRVRLPKLRSKKAKLKLKIRVKGKVAKKLIAGGRFRVTAVATDTAGNKSKPKRLKLRFKPR